AGTRFSAPKGRQKRLPPLWGSGSTSHSMDQGLTPLAIDRRPFGARSSLSEQLLNSFNGAALLLLLGLADYPQIKRVLVLRVVLLIDAVHDDRPVRLPVA